MEIMSRLLRALCLVTATLVALGPASAAHAETPQGNRRGLAFSFTPPSAEKPNMAYEMKIYQRGHFCELTELLAKTGWGASCERYRPRP